MTWVRFQDRYQNIKIQLYVILITDFIRSLSVFLFNLLCRLLMCGFRGERVGVWTVPLPLKIHKDIGFLSHSGLGPLKKITKSIFNVNPSSARKRNAIKMESCWRTDDGPLIWVFGSSLFSSTNKKNLSNPVSRRCFFCGPLIEFLSWFCYAFVRVCLLMPCVHLLGKG